MSTMTRSAATTASCRRTRGSDDAAAVGEPERAAAEPRAPMRLAFALVPEHSGKCVSSAMVASVDGGRRPPAADSSDERGGADWLTGAARNVDGADAGGASLSSFAGAAAFFSSAVRGFGEAGAAVVAAAAGASGGADKTAGASAASTAATIDAGRPRIEAARASASASESEGSAPSIGSESRVGLASVPRLEGTAMEPTGRFVSSSPPAFRATEASGPAISRLRRRAHHCSTAVAAREFCQPHKRLQTRELH